MSSIVQSPDILLELQQRKQAVRRRIDASGQRVAEAASPFSLSRSRSGSGSSHGISGLVSSGIAFYEGARLFLGVVSALRTIFGRRRRRW